MNLRILIFILSMVAISAVDALEPAEERAAKRVRPNIPSLPQDVTMSIFGFVDYASLARSQQVCKLWKTLIDDKLPLSQRYILKYLSQFVQKNNPKRTIKRFEEIFLAPLSSGPIGKTALDDIIEELQDELSGTKEQAYQALLSSKLANTCPRITLAINAGGKRALKRKFTFPYIPANLFKQDFKYFVDQDIKLDIIGRQDSPVQIFGMGNLSVKILGRVTEIRFYMIDLLKIARQFQKLQRLTQFSLNHSQLSSIPVEIGQLTNLQWVELNNNQLSSIPAEIGQLTNLQGLDLSNNRLNSISAKIGRLTNLQGLYLSNNQLSSLPSEIGQLTNLAILYSDNNQLSSIPADIGRLRKLKILSLTNNQLNSMPIEIKEALPNCYITI